MKRHLPTFASSSPSASNSPSATPLLASPLSQAAEPPCYARAPLLPPPAPSTPPVSELVQGLQDDARVCLARPRELCHCVVPARPVQHNRFLSPAAVFL
eukprot:CAMPEP_0181346416 /NCGR_PEP_ID=MMETSP1101-20121128/33315_1 /TAXON_ID=46948 /ORGANISM="Rhodomonas abbreviata, Strain Caron Lab Isolate" /LENGTH=98 /DNA_ID=CAMNT_0023458525 /DNA_START=48 /DNA_END=345 /DNA_ORIENTATION=-